MLIRVKVQTRAKKQTIEKLSEDQYKVSLFVVPEKGKANERLIQILADYFETSKTSIKIVKGERSSNKLIEIIK